MSDEGCVVIVGLGEVGRPLFELLSKYHRTVGVDIAPLGEEVKQTEFLHICYPFQIRDFVGETARYIERFQPKITVINSTVSVGTTRLIAERTGTTVVNSPYAASMRGCWRSYHFTLSSLAPSIPPQVI